MKADGIDISNHTSNCVTEYKEIAFDFVITVCDNAREKCPYFPTYAKKIHYNFPDPAKTVGTPENVAAEFLRVREMIKEFTEKFARSFLAENQ